MFGVCRRASKLHTLPTYLPNQGRKKVHLTHLELGFLFWGYYERETNDIAGLEPVKTVVTKS